MLCSIAWFPALPNINSKKGICLMPSGISVLEAVLRVTPPAVIAEGSFTVVAVCAGGVSTGDDADCLSGKMTGGDPGVVGLDGLALAFGVVAFGEGATGGGCTGAGGIKSAKAFLTRLYTFESPSSSSTNF